MQLLLHDERHDDVPVQHVHVQVPMHRRQAWRMHHLHERRRELRGHVPGLLRMPGGVHGSRLHLLRVPGRDPGLLLLLKAAQLAGDLRPESTTSRS